MIVHRWENGKLVRLSPEETQRFIEANQEFIAKTEEAAEHFKQHPEDWYETTIEELRAKISK